MGLAVTVALWTSGIAALMCFYLVRKWLERVWQEQEATAAEKIAFLAGQLMPTDQARWSTEWSRLAAEKAVDQPASALVWATSLVLTGVRCGTELGLQRTVERLITDARLQRNMLMNLVASGIAVALGVVLPSIHPYGLALVGASVVAMFSYSWLILRRIRRRRKKALLLCPSWLAASAPIKVDGQGA